MYLPVSQADSVGVQSGLVDIQLDSDQLRDGQLLFLHLFSSLQKVVAFLFIEFLLLFSSFSSCIPRYSEWFGSSLAEFLGPDEL